jgi:hypothetical protein
MIGKKRTGMGWQKMCAYMLIRAMGSITEKYIKDWFIELNRKEILLSM